MSRWLTAKIKDDFTGKVLFDLIDRKITKDDPNFMEALKAGIEYKGIDHANDFVNLNIATQEEVNKAITELKKFYGYPNE